MYRQCLESFREKGSPNSGICRRKAIFRFTSTRNLTLAEALERYRKKDSIEKIFHSLKNEIEIKPLRVWTENSIRGAILIVFLAQLFVSLVRYEVPEAKHVATKFIKYSLLNLTVTMMKGKESGHRCLFSNFDALNTAIRAKMRGGVRLDRGRRGKCQILFFPFLEGGGARALKKGELPTGKVRFLTSPNPYMIFANSKSKPSSFKSI